MKAKSKRGFLIFELSILIIALASLLLLLTEFSWSSRERLLEIKRQRNKIFKNQNQGLRYQLESGKPWYPGQSQIVYRPLRLRLRLPNTPNLSSGPDSEESLYFQ